MKENAKKIMDIVWRISFLLMGVCTAVSSVSNILAMPLPPIAARIIGIMQMLSMAMLIYSTVKKARAEAKLPALTGGQ